MASTVPIPEPPGLPFLGNITDLSSENTLDDMKRLAAIYGPIYRLHLPGRTVVILSSNALVNEVCDETRFQKSINSVLKEVRNGVHDGLFTATGDEPNWGIAHRVLTPAFGPYSIHNMFSEMYDISSQLAMKWARHGPETPIMVTDDFTRLALDTIALCSMDYRFNSYYRDELHPFVQAMGDWLTECGNRTRRPPFTSLFYRSADAKFQADIDLMRKTANEVLEARKQGGNSSDRKDLLGAMLNGVDPLTGRRMTDESITDNLITFLIAGHETTSGMLSFAFYELLKNPAAMLRAQKEVDDAIGRRPVAIDDVPKLPYIAAILRETLRLCAPISGFSVEAREDTLLAGKYHVKKGEPITCLLANMHLDPVVYGDDAGDFKPERMLDDNFERLQKEFPNSWKPFGNGKRGCIGRPFAWQEAQLCMAMLLQNFTFSLDDPNYQLQIKSTLTIKPKDFYMRAALRHGMTPTELEHRLAGTPLPADTTNKAAKPAANGVGPNGTTSGKPISIFYGSNSGTCEAFAQRIASDASAHGFYPKKVAPLDAATQQLPTDHPVAIITASYEGQPPDNAARFVVWLESLKGREAENVSYAVFACGHHDWVQTFHRIPKLVDAKLSQLGGRRLADMGSADAASGDMFSTFETWEHETFWPALRTAYGMAEADDTSCLETGFAVEVSNPRSATLRQDVQEAVVVENRSLVEGESPKKHVEIQLPTGMSYTAGDYLAILPLNPRESVTRAMRFFHLAWDAQLTIASGPGIALPTGQAISAFDLLSAYVELAQPATKRNILTLIAATKDEKTINKLKSLADSDYQGEIVAKRVSILNLLEQFPAVALPLGSFLAMLPPMRVRQYSISSSPLWNPAHVTLTYSILDKPSLSGQGRHIGVATSYLSSLSTGDKLHVAVRPSHAAFHLPRDGAATPVICVAAGTGLAPFRGFVQERAAMLAAGRQLAPALLFLGCRTPADEDGKGGDVIYADELARWQALGAVDVRHAFSRAPDRSQGCKYVQDRLWRDRADVVALWNRGAKVYICGSREVGAGVEDVCVRMAEERMRETGMVEGEGEKTLAAARKWWESIRNERYATDVFD